MLSENSGEIKAILTRASDLNRGADRKAYVKLESLNDLRLLLMKVEEPLIILFADELSFPAEVEIMIYDDAIEDHYDNEIS